jgi:hypothetical protein
MENSSGPMKKQEKNTSTKIPLLILHTTHGWYRAPEKTSRRKKLQHVLSAFQTRKFQTRSTVKFTLINLFELVSFREAGISISNYHFHESVSVNLCNAKVWSQ